MSFAYRNVCVTGGAGFIGTYVVEQLLGLPSVQKVLNIDKLTYAAYKPILTKWQNDSRFVQSTTDICDAAKVEQLLKEHNIDCVLHLAAESHVDNSISNGLPFIRTNVEGTYVMCQAAVRAGVQKFVHVSTDEVYGALGPHDPAFTEKSAYQPNSPYSASKAASDHIVRSFVETFNLPAVVTHAGNNYGPRQHLEKLIPVVCRSITDHKNIPVYGTGKNVRDWIFAGDHARAILLVAQKGLVGEHYNIGANNEVDNLTIIEQICDLLSERYPDAQKLITFVQDRPGHDWRYALDTTKLQKLGFACQMSFTEGLAQTVKWYTHATEMVNA